MRRASERVSSAAVAMAGTRSCAGFCKASCKRRASVARLRACSRRALSPSTSGSKLMAALSALSASAQRSLL